VYTGPAQLKRAKEKNPTGRSNNGQKAKTESLVRRESIKMSSIIINMIIAKCYFLSLPHTARR
jgi:hypothetical protein